MFHFLYLLSPTCSYRALLVALVLNVYLSFTSSTSLPLIVAICEYYWLSSNTCSSRPLCAPRFHYLKFSSTSWFPPLRAACFLFLFSTIHGTLVECTSLSTVFVAVLTTCITPRSTCNRSTQFCGYPENMFYSTLYLKFLDT